VGPWIEKTFDDRKVTRHSNDWRLLRTHAEKNFSEKFLGIGPPRQSVVLDRQLDLGHLVVRLVPRYRSGSTKPIRRASLRPLKGIEACVASCARLRQMRHQQRLTSASQGKKFPRGIGPVRVLAAADTEGYSNFRLHSRANF
jgi:hypothetical protein